MKKKVIERKEYTLENLKEDLKKQASDIKVKLDDRVIRLVNLKSLFIDDKREDIQLTEQEIIMLIANKNEMEKKLVLKAIVSVREKVKQHGSNTQEVIKNEIKEEKIKLQNERMKNQERYIKDITRKYEKYTSYGEEQSNIVVENKGFIKKYIELFLSLFKGKKQISEIEITMDELNREIESFKKQYGSSDFKKAVEKANKKKLNENALYESNELKKLQKQLSILDGSKYNEACEFLNEELKIKNNNLNKEFERGI